MHACMHASMQACKHARMQAKCTHARMHACMLAYVVSNRQHEQHHRRVLAARLPSLIGCCPSPFPDKHHVVDQPKRPEYRRLVNANPDIRNLHVIFDQALGELLHLDSRLGLLEALLPGGSLASHRTVWSWYGAFANGEDAGNWNYAVVMHSMV